MGNLLANWNTVAPRLRNAKAIALFLDFDGTLAPLRARPEDAHLPAPARRVLRRLSRRRRMRTWVISGRRQLDVCRRIAVPGLMCLGLYGWENGAPPKLGAETWRILSQARRSLAERLDEAAGLWIEDKGAAFAVHYRGAAPAAVRQGYAMVEEMYGRFGRWLRIVSGDHVWEVLPRELRGKGAAARLRLGYLRQGALPIYFGDDAADETAFEAFSHGITVCVGAARPTRAHFRLRNPAEVCRALQRLDREIP
jgi:trehalose-phosphatase